MPTAALSTAALSTAVLSLAVLSTAALGQPPRFTEDADGDVPPIEARFRDRYLATPIALTGTVLGAAGSPLAGATVTAQGRVATTDAAGVFHLPELGRWNASIEVRAPGHRPAVLPVRLFLPLSETAASFGPIFLTPRQPGSVRFLFGGDTSFGRRYLDPSDSTPRGVNPANDPDALIQVADPLPGSRRVVQYLAPLFSTADWAVVNLETPVTDHPVNPHPDKPFVFHTLPGSLPALHDLGVDYVSLGNNHVYDYLEEGLDDTLRFVEAAGFAWSGAGLDIDQAFEPYRVELAGTPYSFLSWSSVSGSRFAIDYQAGEAKGGSAPLGDSERVSAALRRELDAGRVPIAQLHTGQEYTVEPSPFADARQRFVAAEGAALVIAHHPHVAQGFSRQDGVVVVQCLGNFVLDQARLETLLGLVAEVDLRGAETTRVRGVPIYLEDFRPRPIAGPLAARTLRRVAEVSRDLDVFPHLDQAWVALPGDGFELEERRRRVTVTVGDEGFGVVDLRGLAPPEASLARAVSAVPGLAGRPGRDIFGFGGFEDQDVDEVQGEIARWDVSAASRFVCLHAPYRGAAAACSWRRSTNRSESVIAQRNRARFWGHQLDQPNKDITVFGYLRGDGAGPVSIVARYFASEGSERFGEEVAFARSGGTYPWQSFAADLEVPADPEPDAEAPQTKNPWATRLFLRHAPPRRGEGLVSYDELALISWEENVDLFAGAEFAVPHGRDFLRVEGPPGEHQLELTFTTHRPATPPCRADGATLCLNEGRFRLAVEWTTAGGETGGGRAVPITGDTGAFWFFDDANLELVAKVVDGRPLNGHFWVFYGALSNVEFRLSVTDTSTGAVRAYLNPQGRFASVGDTSAFAEAAAAVRVPPRSRRSPAQLPPASLEAGGSCVSGAATLCLGEGRFRVELDWQDFEGQTGAGQARGLTDDTGYFWFFDPDNVEVVLKVLDGRAVNGHFWVFFGALTNVGFTLEVTDTVTGRSRRWVNPAGRFASVGDTEALRP